MTHVVAPCLGRNARMLAAMAAGLWIVSWDWLSVSQRSRCLVEPVRGPLLLYACAWCGELYIDQSLYLACSPGCSLLSWRSC